MWATKSTEKIDDENENYGPDLIMVYIKLGISFSACLKNKHTC